MKKFKVAFIYFIAIAGLFISAFLFYDFIIKRFTRDMEKKAKAEVSVYQLNDYIQSIDSKIFEMNAYKFKHGQGYTDTLNQLRAVSKRLKSVNDSLYKIDAHTNMNQWNERNEYNIEQGIYYYKLFNKQLK